MKRDSLLLISTSYPDAADGSEAAGAFVADLAHVLATRLPVRVVGPGRVPSAGQPGATPAVWRFAAGDRPLSLLSPKVPTDWPRLAAVLRSMRRQVQAAVADGRVAHILALWALPSGWIAHDVGRRTHIPYSIWALGSDIWTLGKVPGVACLLRRVAADADGCFADGLQLAADAERICGRAFGFLPSTRRTLLPGIAPLRPSAPWRLLFLGRWHPNKGVDLLLQALQQLPEEAWSAIDRVTIAGGGPLEQQVQAGVAALQADRRPVRLSGFLSAQEAAEAMSETDWLVIPSRIESIPVVLSDALKSGRPVVVTAVGDMGELVNGPRPCGIVAEVPTAESIAAAIAKAVVLGPAPFLDGVLEVAARFDLERIADRVQAATVVPNDKG